jgi:hypothetical protein
VGFQSIDNRQTIGAGKCPKMPGFGENLPRNLLIYCAIFLSVTFRSYSTDTPVSREQQQPGGRAAFRSGAVVCGCGRNRGYERRNTSSTSSLQNLGSGL